MTGQSRRLLVQASTALINLRSGHERGKLYDIQTFSDLRSNRSPGGFAARKCAEGIQQMARWNFAERNRPARCRTVYFSASQSLDRRGQTALHQLSRICHLVRSANLRATEWGPGAPRTAHSTFRSTIR